MGPTRLSRIGAALAAVGLALIAVGAVWRVVVAAHPVPVCSGPASIEAAAGGRQLDAALVGEKFATWPGTGLAMLYARAVGAPDCRSRSADYYVVIHSGRFAGDRAVNMGDIVLSPRFELSRQQMIDLAAHEARHRPQWAVATVIAGPFAFPVAYTVDDFFFPGPRNHFERMAGLESGGYRHEGHGPVLGAPQIAVLCAVPVAVVGGWIVVRRRRKRRE